MICQEINSVVEEFKSWREFLYNSFILRPSCTMELLDSLSSNQNAKTVAELSLNPLFRRDYNSVYKGILGFKLSRKHQNHTRAVDNLLKVVIPTLPQPSSRNFYLFGVDTTPKPRPQALCEIELMSMNPIQLKEKNP